MKNTAHFAIQKLNILRRRIARKASRINLYIKESIIGTKYYDLFFAIHNKYALKEKYFITKIGAFNKTASNAVILHLYHTESWDEIFTKKLIMLTRKIDIDLYITMPERNVSYVKVIRKVFPEANLLIVPNRGRDVLPFIKTAAILRDMGYKKVLKIHSKKSTHRDTSNIADIAEGGNAWLYNVLDSLIPEDEKNLGKLVEKINDAKTGMVGSLEYYYPLKMYFGHNRYMIERIARTIDRTFFDESIFKKIEGLGFFGGTMFWVDLDAIADVLYLSKRNFQSEKGQTDGTTAHALERLFCILPHIQGKKVFGITANKLVEIKDASGVYPDWYFTDVSGGKPPISIIVPVYADWESLSKNIKSLRKIVGNSEDISVYYVNDCGPEADNLESKITREIYGITNFYYRRNKQNLGFVKNCNNAALEIVNQRDDILLLNSDTKVTANFVFEMRNALYSDPTIAAVTSRSNNATIWSIPMTGRLAYIRPASYILYQLMKRRLPEKYITPTVHGFCVLIRREVINKYGLFDEIYGKGYGEENDFAMRIRQHGLRCAVANKSFVFHYESKSFGNDVRNQQIEKNEKILTKRYPEYRTLVQEYWDSIKEPLK